MYRNLPPALDGLALRGFLPVVDNHSPYGGLGDSLLNGAMGSDALRNKRVIKFAVEEYPACGTPQEALAYHQLDGRSLAERVLTAIPGTFS